MTDALPTPATNDWAQLLDRIDTSIARALKETAAQEKALKAATTKAKAAEPDVASDRLAGMRAHLDSAARLADAVEALLATDELEARTWVGSVERAAARLASPPATGIR